MKESRGLFSHFHRGIICGAGAGGGGGKGRPSIFKTHRVNSRPRRGKKPRTSPSFYRISTKYPRAQYRAEPLIYKGWGAISSRAVRRSARYSSESAIGPSIGPSRGLKITLDTDLAPKAGGRQKSMAACRRPGSACSLFLLSFRPSDPWPHLTRKSFSSHDYTRELLPNGLLCGFQLIRLIIDQWAALIPSYDRGIYDRSD
jgi:hypothetical protein